MIQVFWRRWTREYLSRLQQRPKWLNHRSELRVNDLVLIRDERQAPLTWPRGRIVKLHPGPDGKTRVVTIKTANNELQRPTMKLCEMKKKCDKPLQILTLRLGKFLMLSAEWFCGRS